MLLFSLYHDIFRTVDASARSNTTNMDELKQTYIDRIYETVANTDDYTDMTHETVANTDDYTDMTHETVANTDAFSSIRFYEEISVVGTVNESYGVVVDQN